MIPDYSFSKRKFIIINIIVSVVFITLAVFCFVQVHNLHMLEMNTQIEQFGFYKSDLTALVENYYKIIWYSIGGAFGTGIGVCIWFDLLYFVI